jgi:quinol-cytochrome oxidoreductase complex cytochrome b subunit
VERNELGHNLSAQPGPPEETEEEEAGHRFWPTHVLDQVIIFYLLGGVLITLAILLPFRLHEPADPLRTPEGIKPEWYFLPMYQALKYVPKVVGIALTTLGGILLLVWPFLDRVLDSWKGPRAYRRVGAVALLLVLVLGVLGWASEQTFTVGGRKYAVDMLGIPHRQAPAAETGAPAPAAGPPGEAQAPAPGTAATVAPSPSPGSSGPDQAGGEHLGGR